MMKVLVLMMLVRMTVTQNQDNFTAEQQLANFKEQTKVRNLQSNNLERMLI